MSIQGYSLPQGEPWDITYDGSSLQVLYEDRLVNLELIETEERFRASEQTNFALANSLAWDASREKYWIVRGAPYFAGEEIDLVDTAGEMISTYTVPKTFVDYPRYLAWDDENLWATTDNGTLYKLQPVGDGGELKVIDSYALALNRYGLTGATGLTWDGNSLWILVGDILSRLDHAAQSVCIVELPSDYPQPSWYGWRGIAWDGQFLWVTHNKTNKVYRVDPALCE
jgi:hypothetical protein